MPLKSILAVVILYSNFLYAGVPPLEQIEDVLREAFSSHTSLISEMTVSTEIVYELKSSRRSYKDKYDLTVEKGKIYSSRQVTKPEGLNIMNQSWNGRLAYYAYSPNPNKSSGQNSITSELTYGAHGLVLNEYDNLGLIPDMIFGSYDSNDQLQLANVDNPLRVFDRVKYEEKTGGSRSKIFLEETTYKGKNLIKMSLRFLVEPLKSRWSRPIVEHILDPEFNYRAVETRCYNGIGLTDSMTRNYSRDNAGNIILVSAEKRLTVLSQNIKNNYPEEDNDKVAVINHYEFDTYKVNEDVDPAVYESENVFIPGLDTFDRGRLVMVDAVAKKKESRPPIYSTDGKGMKRLEKAFSEAQKGNKRILLLIGGNWCVWCHRLHGTIHENKSIHTLLKQAYILVMIDTKMDKVVLNKWDIRPKGYPYLTIIDASGNKLTEQETGSFEVDGKHDPARVLSFLAKWQNR